MGGGRESFLPNSGRNSTRILRSLSNTQATSFTPFTRVPHLLLRLSLLFDTSILPMIATVNMFVAFFLVVSVATSYNAEIVTLPYDFNYNCSLSISTMCTSNLIAIVDYSKNATIRNLGFEGGVRFLKWKYSL